MRCGLHGKKPATNRGPDPVRISTDHSQALDFNLLNLQSFIVFCIASFFRTNLHIIIGQFPEYIGPYPAGRPDI